MCILFQDPETSECDSPATDRDDVVQKLSFEPSFHSERRVKKTKGKSTSLYIHVQVPILSMKFI